MPNLTTKQAATALGISLRLVQLAVKSGTIPILSPSRGETEKG